MVVTIQRTIPSLIARLPQSRETNEHNPSRLPIKCISFKVSFCYPFRLDSCYYLSSPSSLQCRQDLTKIQCRVSSKRNHSCAKGPHENNSVEKNPKDPTSKEKYRKNKDKVVGVSNSNATVFANENVTGIHRGTRKRLVQIGCVVRCNWLRLGRMKKGRQRCQLIP